MKLSHLSLILLSPLFISCGDNTVSSPIVDIQSISINESNISLYSTDISIPLTAHVTYLDATQRDISSKVSWNSSDIYKLSTTLSTDAGLMSATTNGADVNITIDYKETFTDTQSVHIKELLSLNYSDINISDIGTPQTIYITGNFENNESNVSLLGNLFWTVDSNATITESNASQITLTIDQTTSSILLSGQLFPDTESEVDFNNTFY
jgi:hypothetical protein